jgi:hypothetical protein
MQGCYIAYGLRLRSSFELPGLTACDPRAAAGLPTLRLVLSTPHRLGDAWSGPGDAPAWSGRLGDGCDLTIERGVGGDVLFTYGDRARFRLDASREVLECAARDERPDWQRALVSKVLGNVGLMRGYEGLHAAAVSSSEGVVAFAGLSGAGKSTLAIEFLCRGWALFADDMLLLEGRAGAVRAYPATPHVSVAEESVQALGMDRLGETLATVAGERWLAAYRAGQRPSRVHALCLLQRRPGSDLYARPLAANPLLLAPFMLGFQGGRDRQRSRFHLYADLVRRATLIELGSDVADSPHEVADELERALAPGPALAGVAA